MTSLLSQPHALTCIVAALDIRSLQGQQDVVQVQQHHPHLRVPVRIASDSSFLLDADHSLPLSSPGARSHGVGKGFSGAFQRRINEHLEATQWRVVV